MAEQVKSDKDPIKDPIKQSDVDPIESPIDPIESPIDPIESPIDPIDPIESPIDPIESSIKQSDDDTIDLSESDEGTSSRTTLAYLDRIEEVEDGEDKAVLYIGEETEDMIKVILPKSLLPEDAWEGDYLRLTVSIDNADDAASTAEE